MRGLFSWFGVIFASFWSACYGGFSGQLGCGCACVVCLVGVGVVFVCGPPPRKGPIVLVRGTPNGGARCVGAPPPPWLGVMCLCVPPPMVGRAVLALGQPDGGACCVVVWPPSWSGVLC